MIILMKKILRFLAWRNKSKQRKTCKKEISKGLMPVTGTQQDGAMGARQKTRKRNAAIFD